MTQSVDKKTLEYLYLRWIIRKDISFAQAEDDDLCFIFQFMNAPANALLPRSGSTIRLRVLELFHEGQKRTRLMLQNALSSINITCDAWTSPNRLGMLAVVFHFVNKNVKLQTLLLFLKEI